ncbi:MAG TPA: ABC transporter substrate-binding protein [Crinalium sp.]
MVTLALLLLTAACSTQDTPTNQSAAQADPAPTETLRLGYISTGSGGKTPIGPTGWAIHENILAPELKDAGVAANVQLVPFPNGPDLNEALTAGELDVGIYGDTPAIVAKATGLETRLIAQEQVGMNVWLVTPPNGVKAIADLRGKTISTQRGSYMHRYLISVLQDAGLNQTVSVVHLSAKDAQAALERGDIAAYAAPIGLGPLLVSKGFPLIDQAQDHPNLSGTSVVVATQTFLKQHPDFPRIWNQIRRESVQNLKANSEAFYQFQSEATGFPIDVVKASYPLDQFPDTAFPAEGITLLEATKKFLVSQGLAKSDFQINDWIAPESR